MAEHRPNQRATGPGPSLAPDIERDALIAVDLQNDFCPGGALAVPRGDEVVPLANRLMTRYRQVVLTQDWHPPGHHSFARGHPGARIDFWGVGTRLFTGHGEPALSGVYKLAALEEGVAWRPRLKVAERATKTTLPGRKQVWRLRGQEGWWEGDVIAQADEAITPAVGEITGYHPLFEHESKRYGSIASAEPLLEPVLLGGEPVGELPSPAAARERARSQLERLHPTSRRLLNPHTYKVSVSERTLELRRRLREAHERGIGDETYEIVLGYRRAPGRKRAPFVMIYDFVGFDAMSRHPLEQIGVHLWNRTWAGKGFGKVSYVDLGLFIGEEDDVPD
ncbi:MAG: isochorismatase family protein, partial [Candidatus Eisenbacteria bacterium]|nr:isochorismatase family protein [Candidatus Eisenbacteria bacterium]